jgi:heme exporter protein A
LTTKLTANDLTLLRGERCLFKSLDFALSPGELLILEGQNGSGKTSLMRALAGLLEFETGDVKWDGVSVRKNRQAFHGSLVWMAHRVGLKADLTLVENLSFEASLRAQSTADLDDVMASNAGWRWLEWFWPRRSFGLWTNPLPILIETAGRS